MTVHPDVAALLALVPADFPGGEVVDWPAAEAVLGTRLPGDYKSLLDVYGVGDIGELVIIPPLPVDIPTMQDTHIAAAAEQQRFLWDMDGGVPGRSLGNEVVLPWGTGMNGNELAWLMVGDDPDEWPVVAWRRHHDFGESAWAEFDCGMVAFITRMMLGRFGSCPLGYEGLWRRTEPFVSWREQRRRIVAGLDPLTGEPDPYADMYPIAD
ncbi:SMI1/KNR4 family protein [Nocardia sp. NPDC052254]|uniref:SMI1/KNR4 family protein n=1 Tax=Nocardia sp. NPDC052254 TaxID=3155681 RepID=UPI0034228A77